MTIPLSAAAFLGTMGVCTHIPYTDGGYAKIQNVIEDLQYLGIKNVRDGLSNGQNGSAPLTSFEQIAVSGVHFTLVGIEGNAQTTSTLQASLALIQQFQTAVPGAVIAVEGPNEVNNWPITYNGVGGLDGAIAVQKDLYAMVHRNAALAGVAVDYFTGYDLVNVGPNPATTPGLADFNTSHPYPKAGSPPLPWVNRITALPNQPPNAAGPAVYTETGYSTANGTTPAQQASYSLDLYFDAASAGIAHTFLYELMDAYPPGSRQGDDGSGLFDHNNHPKPAATAIHNLTTILADPAGDAATYTPTNVSYNVTGSPTGSLAIQKADGTTYIAVWSEGNAIGSTVSLSGPARTVEVFDPLIGITPVQTLSNASSATVRLTDHPVLVAFRGVTSTGAPALAMSDTITVYLAKDARSGDAQFTLSMDGKTVTMPQSVTALRSSGVWQPFTVLKTIGAGTHQIGVTRANDSNGGAAVRDSNLYVNGISVNGAHYGSGATPLIPNGTASFSITISQ